MSIWAIWFCVFVVGFFAVLETRAMRNGTPTLSRTVWTLNKAFPAFGPMLGFTVGFLFCHFFWGGIVCFAPVP